MDDHGHAGEDDAARLEAALDRIARNLARRAAKPQPGDEPPPTAPGAAIAGRLDALIEEVRAALGRDSAG